MSGATIAAPATGRRRRGLLLVASHTLWFWLLLPPSTAIAHGQVRPTAVAAAGLVTFALLYLALVAVPVADLVVPPVLFHLGLLVFAALGVGLAGAYAGGPEGWLILLTYVATAGAVGLVRPVQGFAWVGGSAVAVLTIGLAHRVPVGDIAASALITVLAGAMTLAFTRTARLVAELRRAQQELARTAVEQERLRFARDLHDLLGHTLSLVVVKAEVVRRLAPADPGRAAAEARDIERIGRTALAEVREAVTGYRDRSFGRELDGARTALADGGITVTVRQPGRPLPVEADDAFGWVLREGVTNVLRHSHASRCEIEVRADAEESVLTIGDDGVGSRVEPGNGLRGLTERLARAGGELHVTSVRGGGLRLTARIPTGPDGSARG
ncbi:sensor histidine kinase [Micromonospora humidisoli]|uniref:Sensor histidine kinase n=1 Tax=Micromonospora humidisoli TaxID=2807622 RepID=A0ABS2JEB4_9ACTN|nr:sensor histidine kinase [Micromonospora humidisoli]MBM7084842.1 sensor histidine kinase [Micromonospora humidisoli]